jgi:hypothetical protein
MGGAVAPAVAFCGRFEGRWEVPYKKAVGVDIPFPSLCQSSTDTPPRSLRRTAPLYSLPPAAVRRAVGQALKHACSKVGRLVHRMCDCLRSALPLCSTLCGSYSADSNHDLELVH